MYILNQTKFRTMNLLKMIFMVAVMSVALIGCKETKKGMEDDIDNAVETVEEAAEDAGEAAGEVVEQVVDSVAVIAKEVSAAAVATTFTVNYPKDAAMASETDAGLKALVKDNPALAKYFNSAYGYAFFPKITKAGLGVGGAGGKGLVFEKGAVIGSSSLMQATFGLQAGGQQYQEIIFFENKAALDKFTNGKFKLAAEASAVALKSGASADVAYQDGVSIFTKTLGGVMAEASVGTQKFKFHGM
jgi:lipid-binding SYLF domain-containing protein